MFVLSAVILCLAARVSLGAGALEDVVKPHLGNDWIAGPPSNSSLLLHSARVLDESALQAQFYWSGPRIRRFEVLDQTNGTGGQVTQLDGGVSHNYLSISFGSWWSPVQRIDFLVNVYGHRVAEPEAEGGGGGDGDNAIVAGELNERSYLVHTERLVGTSFSWENSSWITRFEIRAEEPRNRTNLEQVMQVFGGVASRFLRFYIDGDLPAEPLNICVRIYTEPQDFEIGDELADENLALSRRVLATDNSLTQLHWSSPTPVTRIQALDQTNGTGGFVSYARGIHEHDIIVQFEKIAPNERIDFVVNVFNRATQPNHLQLGNRTADSVLFVEEELTAANVPDAFWSYRSRDPITWVQLLDQTNGTGARVDFHTLDQFDLHLWFSMGGPLHFRIAVYGERLAEVEPNDLVLGELSPLSFVVDRRAVEERRWSVATYVFESEHRLTRIEIIDRTSGRSGRPQIVHGGIGQRNVVVLFATDENARERINFAVTVYAG